MVALIAQSFERGHYKVALRRAFMHTAAGYQLPPHLAVAVRAACDRCREVELEKMRAAGLCWAQMVSHACG